MSEYVKKQALLEYLIPRTMRPIMSNIGNSPFYDGMVEATEIIIQEVKSGAFDADATYDEWRQLAADSIAEVQRLRAALVEIKQLLNENRENDGAFQSWNHMQAWKVATQALSTTTEPTNKYFGAEWPKAEGDGNDA